MNQKDPSSADDTPSSINIPVPPTGYEPIEIANKNQDAHVSDLTARMAKVETLEHPVETPAKTTQASNRRTLVFALWAPLVFTLVLLFLATRNQHIRDADAGWVLHTVKVKNQLATLCSLLKDVETSQRGYLLTGDASFLEPYEQALKEIPGQSQNLADLIEDNPKQVTAAANLQTLITAKLSIAAQPLSLARQGKLPDAVQIVREGEGKRLMDKIRQQVNTMNAEEEELLRERENVFTSQVKSQEIEMVGLVAVEIALIVSLTLLLVRSRKLELTAGVRIGEAHAIADHAQASNLKAIFRTKRAEGQTVEAHAMTDHAQASTLKAIISSEQAKVRTVEANERTEQAEATTTMLYTCISHLNDILMITEAESVAEEGRRILFVNDAFERITGYTSAETLGKAPRFLQGEKTDPTILVEIRQALKLQKPIRRQIVNYGKGGHEYWIDIDIVPIFDSAGKCVHFASIQREVTEQKKAELAFQESESRYSSLFANMLGGYAYCQILFEEGRAVDLVYLEVNNTFETLTGLKDVVGKKISEVIPGIRESNPDLLEMYGRVALTGTPEKSERYVAALGIWFSVSAYSNKAEHISAVFENITERKQTEARFRRLVDSNAQGVIFWNLKGGITGANEAFLRLVRYTREDLEAGRINWMAMTPPEFARLDLHAVEEIGAKGACTAYEKEFIRKDGSRVPVLLGSAAFEDNPDEGVSFILDLSESKCAAEQIEEQAALLDEAQDAITVRDLEGKAIFWNKGAERLYGWTRQEILGRNISEIIFSDPKKFAEINALTIREGKWSGDLQHVSRDKRGITVESRWTLIRDKEGRPKSVLAINTDVTEKKKIEAQFMRAQRMESIGTLAAGIAHDLNNILAPIMMSIDVLKLTATDSQSRSILDTIEVSSKRGSDIVRQVLSFARGLDGERIEIQPSHLLKDLRSIIKDTFPKNIRLEFTIPDDTWMILGDPTQVHQILLNLCVNARDAMPNGGNLTVSIENCMLDDHYAAMHTEAKAGRYVNISVTDSGTGMPQGILDKIFEPFFTTKELHEGTGLGLSTVTAIVKSHGGVIDVYSEPDKGTTFKVYLPALELSPEAQQELTQQISVPRGNGETILVIDDENSILTITSQTLKTFGYQVLTAGDGAEAVAIYAEHRKEIAVVLTDMSMPIMDGAAVIRTLMKINPAVKIIAASGLSSNGSVTKATGTNVKHFLTKPYTAGTLVRTLRAILDEK